MITSVTSAISTKQKVWLFAKISIYVTGIYLFVRSGYFNSPSAVLFFGHRGIFGILLLLGLTYDSVRGFSLFWILKTLGMNVNLNSCIKLQFIGHFFNFFIPGQAGGVAAKAVYLTRITERKLNVIFAALFIELLIGFFALPVFCLLFLSVSLQNIRDKLLFNSVLSLTGIDLLLCLLIFLSTTYAHRSPMRLFKRGRLKEYSNLLLLTLGRPKLCFQVAALAFFTYLLKCLALFIATPYLNPPPGISYPIICAGFSVGVLVSLVPLAPGGLVSGQIGFKYVYDLLTATHSPFGGDLYLIFWAIHGTLGVLGGLFFMLDRRIQLSGVLANRRRGSTE